MTEPEDLKLPTLLVAALLQKLSIRKLSQSVCIEHKKQIQIYFTLLKKAGMFALKCAVSVNVHKTITALILLTLQAHINVIEIYMKRMFHMISFVKCHCLRSTCRTADVIWKHCGIGLNSSRKKNGKTKTDSQYKQKILNAMGSVKT